MRLLTTLSAVAMAGTFAVPASADIAAGKANAACAVCHGVQGVATLPNAPNLADQPQIYLVEQLKNYRSGKRTHEVMAGRFRTARAAPGSATGQSAGGPG